MGKASVRRRVASIAVAAMATPIRQCGEILSDRTFPTRRSCAFLGAGAMLRRL